MTAPCAHLVLITDGELRLEVAKLAVSVLGFLAVVLSLFFGFRQQRKAERWKLGEFIESQIGGFLADPYVRNALLMVDWGRRRINIDQTANLPDAECPLITRGIQWRALLPHDVKTKHVDEYRDPAEKRPPSADSPSRESGGGGEDNEDVFSTREAKIRETYDALLGHLQRFSHLIDLGLIDQKYFEPYLRYWVESMAGDANPEYDATWRFVLLNYINFYGYDGVVSLFARYGRDIGPLGRDYSARGMQMINNAGGSKGARRTLASRLRRSLKEKMGTEAWRKARQKARRERRRGARRKTDAKS